MTTRSTDTTVTFSHSFKLHALEQPQPAGTYRVVIDEEEIVGLSFLAYRRIATMFHTPAVTEGSTTGQVHVVEQADLSDALDADKRPR
jgi:hypothetical protein